MSDTVLDRSGLDQPRLDRPAQPIVDEETIERFRADGVVVLRNVVDAEWVERLREGVAQEMANPSPTAHAYESTGFFGGLDLWRFRSVFEEFVLRSRLGEYASAMFGSPTVRMYYDQLFVKAPGASQPVPWHNDQPYWPISGRQVMSFWIALDEVDATSGRVEYVRGSHAWDRWFQPRTFAPTNAHDYTQNPDYEPAPDVEADRDAYDIVSFDLQPGDAIAFWAMILHGSRGNSNPGRARRGYAVRYIGDDVRYDPRIGTADALHYAELEPGAPMATDHYPVVWPRPV
ncbi:phytanoyl-CoA dioxygenase family protein [Candidatus Poriferisodalis sp.]|uniref:phytanoyl-CoA dioxygenase family protein n=1 Tax=Candidatus Poriferisodalis sp. TaxID=3101277 RepID=UPI003AF4A7F8